MAEAPLPGVFSWHGIQKILPISNQKPAWLLLSPDCEATKLALRRHFVKASI